MAEQTLAGRGIRLVRPGLLADGFAKGRQLVCREDKQEGFEQNYGFPEAGIEVEVIRIDLFPDASRVCRSLFGKIHGCVAEILAKIFDHLFQSADLVEKLEAVGKQDTIQKATHARGEAASLTPEIPGIEGSGVWDGAVMPGMLGKGAEQGGKRFGQQRAQIRGNGHGLEGFTQLTVAPETDGLIEHDAPHGVDGFEFLGVPMEKLFFLIRQPGKPVFSDRYAAGRGGAGAVFHGRSPYGAAGGVYQKTIFAKGLKFPSRKKEYPVRLVLYNRSLV